MNIAEQNEITYNRYRKLRSVATKVLPSKIEEKEISCSEYDFEKLCNTVLYSFDEENQELVSKSLGVSREILVAELILLSNGARLFYQRA